jgi:hypothetical protein
MERYLLLEELEELLEEIDAYHVACVVYCGEGPSKGGSFHESTLLF